MKRSLPALLALIALTAVASPASAVQPDISRYGFTVVERVGPSVCGFPFVVEVRGKGQSILFRDGDGDITRGIATGPITISFVNRATGATARYSVSGPSFYDADGELARGTGRWYVFTSDGRPAIAVGNLTFDDDGAPERPAHVVDVCDALS